MGSPQFAVPSLELLHASGQEVPAVVTQPDRPRGRNLTKQPSAVKVAARKLGLPVLQPVTTKSNEFLEEIKSFRPDLLVVVAYGEILSRALLDIPLYGAINLHASLLPRYRGAAPVAWAILRGETETGATTMLLNEVMDGGPILLQERCRILETDTTNSLTERISHIGAPLLQTTLDILEKKVAVPVAQDVSQVTYAPKLRKEDGNIDWNKPASWTARQIRAFDPWPGVFSWFHDIRVKFRLAHCIEGTSTEIPGTVVRATNQSLVVACGEETLLELHELQPESKPRISAASFIHGYHVDEKQRFYRPSILDMT